MHEKLHDAHLLPCELVPDGRAGGIAVRPGAVVNQMHRTSFGWWLVVPAVMEAAVPAVKGSGQRGPFDLHVDPVAETQHKRALLAHSRKTMHAKSLKDSKLHSLSVDNFM